MGKYIRKSKLTGEVAVMEVSAESSIGVRTRARTLALQCLHNPSSTTSDNSLSSSPCYLQLRSRRLEKPTTTVKPRELPEPKFRAATGALPAASFGENVLEVEVRERNARETTPCSLIRDSEAVRTPGSTTRGTTGNVFNQRIQNVMHLTAPSAHEMEDFFAVNEHLQQRTFMEKYNFDPVNDCPLPGRYDWVNLDS